MKQLQEGFISTKDLADWMGIAYSSFRRGADKRYETIKEYADFERVRGGIIVKNVLYSEYVKGAFKQDDKCFLVELCQCNEGLSSASGMARKIEKEGNMPEGIKIDTLRKRLIKARDRTCGKPIGREEGIGICGRSKYVWAIKIDNYNKYRKMTEEEEQDFKQIAKDFYNGKIDELIEIGLYETLDEDEEDEATAEEIRSQQAKLHITFKDLLSAFYLKTGLRLVKVTEHMLNDWKKD